MSAHACSAAVFSLFALGVSGCGGPAGLPLLGGSVTGEYKGAVFTPTFGIAFERSPTSQLVILGDQDIHCESPLDDDPPGGRFGSISLTSLEVGSYGSVLVQVMENIDSFEGRGSNAGSVEITASPITEVAGTVAFQHTDDEGQSYKLNGDFRVTRCAPKPD